NDATKIDDCLISMNKYLYDYSEKYDEYNKCIKIYEQQYHKQFDKKLKFNYLPVLSKLNVFEKSIIQILDKIEQVMKYKFNYVYKWNFMVEGENTNILKLPIVNYQQPFVYDFYGITMCH